MMAACMIRIGHITGLMVIAEQALYKKTDVAVLSTAIQNRILMRLMPKIGVQVKVGACLAAMN
jgi:hypothetical protein